MLCLSVVTLEASLAQSNRPTGKPAGPQKAPQIVYSVPLLAEGVTLSDFAAMEPRPELKDKLLARDELVRLIADAGFTPVQRDTLYREVRRF